jgi:hypothetical protein
VLYARKRGGLKAAKPGSAARTCRFRRCPSIGIVDHSRRGRLADRPGSTSEPRLQPARHVVRKGRSIQPSRGVLRPDRPRAVAWPAHGDLGQPRQTDRSPTGSWVSSDATNAVLEPMGPERWLACVSGWLLRVAGGLCFRPRPGGTGGADRPNRRRRAVSRPEPATLACVARRLGGPAHTTRHNM